MAVVVEAGSHIGLVELLAQDCDRDRAEFPLLALHQEIVRRVARGGPCAPQARYKELARRLGVARQSLGEIGRTLAVVGVDVADQRFRRAEPGVSWRGGNAGQQNQNRKISPQRAHRLYLHPSISYCQAYDITDRRKPKPACANYSMKSPDNRRSIPRRRCAAPRAAPSASGSTSKPVSRKPMAGLPSRSMASRSARHPAGRLLRQQAISPKRSPWNGMRK